MSDWKINAAMYWYYNNAWVKITDHGRSPITVTPTRIESSDRMVNGTLRRYVVAQKNEFSVNWSMIPSDNDQVLNGRPGMNTVDNGWAGRDIELFCKTVNDAFKLRLRRGIDLDKNITDASIEEYTVMVTSFNKEIVKRGATDFWNIDVTLTEV